jgi:hypothetical protein
VWVHHPGKPFLHRQKFAERAQPGRFLGFEHPFGSGEDKVLLDNGGVTQSQTVVFDDAPFVPLPAHLPNKKGEQQFLRPPKLQESRQPKAVSLLLAAVRHEENDSDDEDAGVPPELPPPHGGVRGVLAHRFDQAAREDGKSRASANRAGAAGERLIKEKHQRVAGRSVSQGNPHLAPSGLTHARLLLQSLCAAMLCRRAEWQRLSQGPKQSRGNKQLTTR